MSLAFAYEQAARPRRPAPTTPALVNGKVPPPVPFEAVGPGALRVRLEFDPISGRLTYELPSGTQAASIHRGTPGPDSPVLHRLIDPASAGSPATPSR